MYVLTFSKVSSITYNNRDRYLILQEDPDERWWTYELDELTRDFN